MFESINILTNLSGCFFTMKKVRFSDAKDEIHYIICWQYAYRAARQGTWMRDYMDKCRFKRRIEEMENVLVDVLNNEHRNKVYYERFNLTS